MRILLIVIAAVAMLVVGVVGIGSLMPKRHSVSRCAAYRATPEQLFSLIAGPQNWRPDVLRYEAVPGSEGREMVRETTRDGETVTYELVDSAPPRSLKRRVATENLPYSGTWTYSLERKGDTTVVRITEERRSLQSSVSVYVAFCPGSRADDGSLPSGFRESYRTGD